MADHNRSLVKNLTLLGTLGALLYTLHVVLGGILWKGYDHIMQPISDLTATGAPDRVLLSGITLVYGLFSITFAVCAYLYLRKSVPGVARVGMITFIAMHSIVTSIILFLAGGTTAMLFANKLPFSDFLKE